MRISELLKAYANDLENPDNEALLLAEEDDTSFAVVVEAFVKAAAIIKQAAEDVELLQPHEEQSLTPESLEELAAVAQNLDESGDPEMQKKASVLDEILLTISSPRDAKIKHTAAEDKRIEELKKKYNHTTEETDPKVAEAVKDIQKSDVYKTYRPLEAPLETRYCPDHAGSQIARIGDHRYQCDLDKRIYDFENGYKTLKGNTVPGTSVENQTPDSEIDPHAVFDTRESRLGVHYQK